MKLIDILLWVVGAIAAVLGIWQLARFMTAKDAAGLPDMWAGTNHLYMAIAAIVVAIVCVVWAFVRRPHTEEEIHITE